CKEAITRSAHARKNKRARPSARATFRFLKLPARGRQDRQPAKRPATSTQSARLGNPTSDTAARPRELFVAEQSARGPSEDKKSDRPRQYIRATGYKHFRRRACASPRLSSRFAAKSEAPSKFPERPAQRPEHAGGGSFQLCGRINGPAPSRNRRARPRDSVRY